MVMTGVAVAAMRLVSIAIPMRVPEAEPRQGAL